MSQAMGRPKPNENLRVFRGDFAPPLQTSPQVPTAPLFSDTYARRGRQNSWKSQTTGGTIDFHDFYGILLMWALYSKPESMEFHGNRKTQGVPLVFVISIEFN